MKTIARNWNIIRALYKLLKAYYNIHMENENFESSGADTRFYFHEHSQSPLPCWLMMSLSFCRSCGRTIKKQWKFSFTACAGFMYIQIDSHFPFCFYLTLPWQTVWRKWETSGVVDNSVFDSFTLRERAIRVSLRLEGYPRFRLVAMTPIRNVLSCGVRRRDM